jgi:hypothetical protein
MDIITATQVPDSLRDEKWETEFLQALTNANLVLISENPIQGPDGWPYLLAQTSPEAQEPAQKILSWLSTRGMGLVVNPTKEYPDYVFSYGMIWSFRETGYFYKDLPQHPTGVTEFNPSMIAHAGTPTLQYLPEYVRQILREFFRDQGAISPKILMVSQDRVHYDIAFSLESLGNPPESEHPGVAEAIGWFLPPHYSLMLVSEKGLPTFTDL